MIPASAIKKGMAIKVGNDLFKVIAGQFKSGTGKMGGTVHAKLKNVATGAVQERRFHPDEKLNDVELEKKPMEFIYQDKDSFYFMDPQSFEQIPVNQKIIGNVAKFLQPNMKVPVEFYEENAVSIEFPEIVEAVVTAAPPGIHGQDSVYKPITLENGLEIMAPQFIKSGDKVKVNVETQEYVERVKK